LDEAFLHTELFPRGTWKEPASDQDFNSSGEHAGIAAELSATELHCACSTSAVRGVVIGLPLHGTASGLRRTTRVGGQRPHRVRPPAAQKEIEQDGN
jgi:hypothetical protein